MVGTGYHYRRFEKNGQVATCSGTVALTRRENEANKIKKTNREKTTTKTTEIRQYQAEG